MEAILLSLDKKVPEPWSVLYENIIRSISCGKKSFLYLDMLLVWSSRQHM